ncbi:MAG: zf-HC2 domain-containing protein [Deltaproteobacteria bacterium]|nr:zf-HC2 domain-containing protein [Myxococcales bacterium]MDP3219984.1 zf-HC2 domain-containing protein [Deltaproteobacteria bacterium]
MDCETCNDLLLDLHYDELDAARAAEVRAHLDGCDECRAASEGLGRTRVLASKLSLPDAPVHSAAVMAALTSTAPVTAAVSGRVSAVIPIERAREARSVGWLQRVGELAMRRQVAMVAISLLMVGLGLRYLPFRSPTQSVTTEMAQPEVIPATELAPTPEPAPTPAAAPANSMRSRAPVARPVAPAEGRVQAHAARAQNVDAVRGADLGSGSASGRSARPLGNASSAGLARSAPLSEAEAVAADPPAPVAAAAPGSRGGYAQVPADEERQLQAAMPAAPAPAPSSWSSARASAESASSRGDLSNAIANYQRALALDPPPAERQAIALALHRALNSAGRGEEANRVRAQYLTPAADPAALAGQVPSSAPRTQTGAGMVQPSAPRPAATRPARRSNSNVQTDFNQSAY